MLFLLAVLLAFPTSGISIVAWLIYRYIRYQAESSRLSRRVQVREEIIKPLLNDRYLEYFIALAIPIRHGISITHREAEQCGRHIINFISHNPSVTSEFLKELQELSNEGGLIDPIEALRIEREIGGLGNIHMISYKSMMTLIRQNDIPCFNKVDMIAFMSKLNSM